MRKKFRLNPQVDLHNYRQALGQILDGNWTLPRDLLPSALNAAVPPVDVLDNGTEIVVKTNLPGVNPEDVQVNIANKTLTIRASLAQEDEDTRGATYLQHERRTTGFLRTITLPFDVETAKAAARMKHGVLTLILPKSASRRPNVIKVTKA